MRLTDDAFRRMLKNFFKCNVFKCFFREDATISFCNYSIK